MCIKKTSAFGAECAVPFAFSRADVRRYYGLVGYVIIEHILED